MVKKKIRANDEDKIDMFYGFWKHLGVMGSFTVGVILFWWGSNILIHDFFVLRINLGFLAFLALAPLFFGSALTWLAFSEFLSIIRTN